MFTAKSGPSSVLQPPTYLGELRANIRTLSSAAIGLSAGYSITNYTNNIFVPNLLQAFSWTKSQMALVGITLIISAACQPVAGHITDRYGVRRMIWIGLAATPIVYLGFSAMTGSFALFFLLTLLQIVTVATTTGPVVHCRSIVERFSLARGTALAIAMSSPAMVGALVVPLLSKFINANGWRAGYVVFAICATIGGFLALVLISGDGPDHRVRVAPSRPPSAGYRELWSNRAFQLLMAGTVLCNLSLSMQLTQLKVIFLDRGLASNTASWLISTYATGAIIGRLTCGLTLDRFPAHSVAAISLGAPAVGLAVLAAGSSNPAILAIAVLSLGLSIGAEGDVLGYLVRRHFGLSMYSGVLGFLMGALALSGGIGALILSATLKMSGRYTPFLLMCAISTIIGSASMLVLGRLQSRADAWAKQPL